MTEEEFDSFYQAAFPRVVGQIYAMTGDLAEAQDAVQEAFVRAWDRRGQLDRSNSGGHGPEAWVRTVAWRLAVSRWRRAKSALTAFTKHGAPADEEGPGIHNVVLVTALKQIPEAQRRVIVLHHLCDLSVEEVAAETRQPVGTVKAQLSRGRAALKLSLTETAA